MNDEIRLLFGDLREAGYTDEMLAAALGVGGSAIRTARAGDKLSARWYGPLNVICRRADISLPMEVFSWAAPVPDKGAA